MDCGILISKTHKVSYELSRKYSIMLYKHLFPISPKAPDLLSEWLGAEKEKFI
jgi:hypothetical protein